ALPALTVLRILAHRRGDVIVDPVITRLVMIVGAAPANGVGTDLTDGWDRHRRLPQYVARPPEMSKTPPVENEHSSLESQQIRAAISDGSTKRFIGIFESM